MNFNSENSISVILLNSKPRHALCVSHGLCGCIWFSMHSMSWRDIPSLFGDIDFFISFFITLVGVPVHNPVLPKADHIIDSAVQYRRPKESIAFSTIFVYSSMWSLRYAALNKIARSLLMSSIMSILFP